MIAQNGNDRLGAATDGRLGQVAALNLSRHLVGITATPTEGAAVRHCIPSPANNLVGTTSTPVQQEIVKQTNRKSRLQPVASAPAQLSALI